MTKATLRIDGNEYELPVVEGSEGEVAVDITALRGASGAITLDPGYGNTGSCLSSITFIDGDRGILRYRGYPIEQLASRATFLEVAYLLIHGELPQRAQLEEFAAALSRPAIPAEIEAVIDAFPKKAHPMTTFAALVSALEASGSNDSQMDQIHRLLAATPVLAAWAERTRRGQERTRPKQSDSYTENFLRLMCGDHPRMDMLDRALNLLLILHADHEQNCSTSTVRMVGSSQANLFSSIAAGVAALSGPLHGGANQEVIEMLEKIEADGGDYAKYVALAKQKGSGFKLMGFGHRVYKNFDPRAKVLKGVVDETLEALGVEDPLLDIARNLEQIALSDSYFVERKLYPNVDFYSGILYRAMGIPTDMFTVMFAFGRMPGWVAQWKELVDDSKTRINRPRQIYTGAAERDYVALEERERELVGS